MGNVHIIAVSIPTLLRKRMKRIKGVNWSAVATVALEEAIDRLEKQGTPHKVLTIKDVAHSLERLWSVVNKLQKGIVNESNFKARHSRPDQRVKRS